KLLKAVVDKEQPQLVLLGKQTIDSDNNQTGQMLGALTGMAQGTFASEVAIDGEKVNVTREIDGGLRTVALKLPAIVTTDLRLNEPRYASLPNIMKAKRKPLDVTTPADLGVEVKSTLSLVQVTPPAQRKAGIKVASIEQLVDKLKNEAKVLEEVCYMSILVIAEHDNATLKAASLNVVAAAAKIGGDIDVLVAGSNCGAAADAAAKIAGVAKVLVADNAA